MMRKALFGVALLALPLPAQGDVAGVEGLTLDLYISFEMEYQIEAEGNGDPNGSFDADQIDIVFNYVRDKFRIAVDSVYEHGTATEDNLGNVAISFGFAEYAFSPKLKVRAGEYLTPFGLHNPLNSAKSTFRTVKIPLATNKPDKLAGEGFRFFPRREVGLALAGTVPVGGGSLDYDVVVANGEQEETNPFEEDNNSQKALNTRLVFQPSLSWNVGFSTYFDTITAEGEDISLRSLSAHTQFEGEHVRIWAEVVYGVLDHDLPALADVDQWSGFVEFSYMLDSRLAPYLQVQYQRTETDLLDESATLLIPGIYYEFQKYAVIKAEWAYNQGSRDNGEFNGLPGRDYNEVRAAIVLGF